MPSSLYLQLDPEVVNDRGKALQQLLRLPSPCYLQRQGLQHKGQKWGLSMTQPLAPTAIQVRLQTTHFIQFARVGAQELGVGFLIWTLCKPNTLLEQKFGWGYMQGILVFHPSTLCNVLLCRFIMFLGDCAQELACLQVQTT